MNQRADNVVGNCMIVIAFIEHVILIMDRVVTVLFIRIQSLLDRVHRIFDLNSNLVDCKSFHLIDWAIVILSQKVHYSYNESCFLHNDYRNLFLVVTNGKLTILYASTIEIPTGVFQSPSASQPCILRHENMGVVA